MDRMAHALDIGKPIRDEEERQSIEDILTAAEEWSRGECSFNAVMQLGRCVNYDGRISPGRSRHIAYWTALRAGDPRAEHLGRVMDVATEARMTWTHQGWYSRDDLHTIEAADRFIVDQRRYRDAA